MSGRADFLALDVGPVKLRLQVQTPLAYPRGTLPAGGWKAAIAEVAGRVGQLLFPQFSLALSLFRGHSEKALWVCRLGQVLKESPPGIWTPFGRSD